MKNVLAMVGNGVCGVTYADMRTGKASVSIQLPLTYYAKGFESPTPHQTAAGNCGSFLCYGAMLYSCQLIQHFLCGVPELFLSTVKIFQISIIDSPSFVNTPGELIEVVAGISEQGN